MKIEDGRNSFYQWDQGQRILMEDHPTGVEVHFAIQPRHALDAIRCETKTAWVTESYEENGKVWANVPNQLLQIPGELVAYVYIESATHSETIASQSFMVYARPRPADYVFTESEIRHWDQLDERIAVLERTLTENMVSSYDGTVEVK